MVRCMHDRPNPGIEWAGRGARVFYNYRSGLAERISQTQCTLHFLVYLHGKTWTSGEMSDSFAQNVRQAMDAGINLLLVYETVGGGRGAEQKSRFACTFEELRKVTPPDLIERGVYNKIALGMKGGPWRKASMIKLAKALNERAGAD